MTSKLTGTKKEDELREKIIDMISRIESINAESHEIIQGLGKTLDQYEKLYDELYNSISNELKSDEIIVKSRYCIESEGKIVDGLLKILSNNETSYLDRNSIYPMLIDTIWNMIMNYLIIITQINHLSK